MIEVVKLCKSYRARQVLRDITFTLARGRTLALVGPSGSGKTTLARCLVRLETPDSGEIHLGGRAQMIFQQPAASLSPRFTAAEIVAEPLVIHRWGTKLARRAKAIELMQTVGLAPAAADKLSTQFSGGERQRLAIARALALDTQILILDESFTGLDPALQDRIATLLLELQAGRNLTYIFISHDLAMAARMAQEIAVLYQGAIVESGSTADVLANPRHPVTQELAEATRLLSV